jgi:carboxyl-terminal processing protease
MAQELTMKSRGRMIVLGVSIPVIAFAVVGGFMSRAIAREDGYQSLRIFQEVVDLILSNYVEDVNVDNVMQGAMHGLADGLDPDSAYLNLEQVKAYGTGAQASRNETGIELTRQYYLRVISARDGSPAAKAGLRPGDYVRAIDGMSTRDMSTIEGMRRLSGKPGSKVTLTVLRGNAAEPHELSIVRETVAAMPVKARIAGAGTAYVRVAEFGATTAAELRREIDSLSKQGAQRIVVDVRGTAFGDVETGIAAARLFVKSGTLIFRRDRGKEREAVDAGEGDGVVGQPLAVLVDNGTSGAAEVFAGALTGNKRAALIGERTLGRAAKQKLVKLPDGSAMVLTHLFYLTPAGQVIHEHGLTPDVAVEQPDLEFGAPAPTSDPTLDKAIEHLTAEAKKAA